jgi:hypothetical protein
VLGTELERHGCRPLDLNQEPLADAGRVSFSLSLSFRSGHTVPEDASKPLYDWSMQRDMQREEARKVITSALRLARERVTGGLDEKEVRRERLSDLMARMDAGTGQRPTGDDLTDALGDPDDNEVREAIRAWSQEDAPVTPQ